MSEAVVVGGRRFEPSVLRLIRKWVKESPELSRAALSRKVCEQLNWRAENGRLQEMSCRVALVRLDERGVIELPAARNARGGLRKTDRWRAPPDAALYCTVAELGKIRLVAVNTPALGAVESVDCRVSLCGVQAAGRTSEALSDQEREAGIPGCARVFPPLPAGSANVIAGSAGTMRHVRVICRRSCAIRGF